MSCTIVCFHAHPDDEALLMGGTMARLAAEGHRVVLVTATAGEQGLAADRLTRDEALGTVREAELRDSAHFLGCARVVLLGYPDSGPSDVRDRPPAAAESFATTPVEDAALRVARILVEEQADVLTIYDPAGGYGHPDHIQVYRVGLLAADFAHTKMVLEATVDRKLLRRALRCIHLFRWRSPDFAPKRFKTLFAEPHRITHRIDVGSYLPQKRAALEAHRSQASVDDDDRFLAWILRLPPYLFQLGFRYEWFVEHGRTPARKPLNEILASLGSDDGAATPPEPKGIE
jgi:LmbE family N-acetylglucosaminyl deacetylase